MAVEWLRELGAEMKAIFALFIALVSTASVADMAEMKLRCASSLDDGLHVETGPCKAWLDSTLSGTDFESQASASLDYATALELAGNGVEAESFYKRAVGHGEQSGKGIAVLLTSEALARYYYRNKAYSQAIKPFEEAIPAAIKLFGFNHAKTIGLIVFLADAKRMTADYQSAVEVVDSALASTLRQNSQLAAIFGHALNIRALSLEKLGRTKEAFSSYMSAAQLMETSDIASAIVIWKNLRAALIESKLATDTKAVDEKIWILSQLDAVTTDGSYEFHSSRTY